MEWVRDLINYLRDVANNYTNRGDYDKAERALDFLKHLERMWTEWERWEHRYS